MSRAVFQVLVFLFFSVLCSTIVLAFPSPKSTNPSISNTSTISTESLISSSSKTNNSTISLGSTSGEPITRPGHITVNQMSDIVIKSTTKSPPSVQSTIAVHAGIGGGVGALAFILIVVVSYAWYSKRKQSREIRRNRVDVSSSGSDNCPSWRHANFRPPFSLSRITERTENSSSHK